MKGLPCTVNQTGSSRQPQPLPTRISPCLGCVALLRACSKGCITAQPPEETRKLRKIKTKNLNKDKGIFFLN